VKIYDQRQSTPAKNRVAHADHRAVGTGNKSIATNLEEALLPDGQLLLGKASQIAEWQVAVAWQCN
jgi:hypothetical protein